ncbi:MarR family winged helix-turn-helix transcriptional regulator [Streptomyces profundus]|uniref:MarR family winged helix-turn-helix transcriptional regulator n=1 Tax=Streptomyces profundus TaxID=2867410 RepID=UPI001D164CE6|nr:MarR family winged helix-turn-helix transcriptional regulator [Streptomyces sp. MA3_2.13]UED83368.1 MarR family winged helix-turn-helix transcriptional regulator [Streptomyces sp. MA3_2.13]
MPSTPAPRPDDPGGAGDVSFLLTRAERLAARRLRAALDETGCSVDAWRVLALLADGRGHGMTAIAERTLLPPPSLTRLMDQLVDDGLVHRRVDPLDRRRVLAGLTPHGMAVRADLAHRVRAHWATLPADTDDALLATLLDRLIARLELPAPAPAVS